MHCPSVGTKLFSCTDTETFSSCAVHFFLDGTSWMRSCAAASVDSSSDPDVSHPYLSRPGLLRLLKDLPQGKREHFPVLELVEWGQLSRCYECQAAGLTFLKCDQSTHT